MRELHVVALSEDGRSVLLATSKKATTGGYRLKLDDKIRAALKGDLPRPGESAVRSTGVSPKEIQSRMRAGESAEEIAAAAGVPVARIERFAGPVLSERERIIEEARAGFLSRGRLGPSLLPLGDAVDAALAETPSLRPETVAWTARRLDSGHWLVQVSYVSRARTRTGSWVYDPHTRSLVPSDPASAALGHTGEEASARKSAAPAVGAPRSRQSAPKRKPAKRTAAGSRATARPGTTRRAATSPAAKRSGDAAAKRAADAAARRAAEVAAERAERAAERAERAAALKAERAAALKAEQAAAARAERAAARKAEEAAAALAERAAALKAEQAAAARAERAAARAAERAAAERAAQAAAAKAQKEAAARAEREAALKAARVAKAEAAAARRAAKRDAATTDAEAAGTEPESPPTLRVVPAPPAELVPTPVPKRRAAGERATVPDWADVLFGTAPRSDRNDG